MIEGIGKEFPNVAAGRDYFSGLNNQLFQDHGFTRGNTRFAEAGCCDEINEPEYIFLRETWGERFKFGGLAGYCHGGRTGLTAVSHHVPAENGRQNLLLVAGPHIGYHRGEWGVVPRPGQRELTTSCGSLAAALSTGLEALQAKPEDPLDLQQKKIESIVIHYLESTEAPNLIDATRYLNLTVTRDLLYLASEIKTSFAGQVAVVTGVTINTEHGNYFAESENTVL